MRIIMLSWEYPPRLIGGLARAVHDLSNALAEKDVTVQVVTCEHPGAPAEEVAGGVEIYRVPGGPDYSNFMQWIKVLNDNTEAKVEELLKDYDGKKGEPVLLHAHDWLSEFAAKSLKLRHKIPLIATVHATEHGRHYGIHSDMQRHISHIEWELTYEAWRVIVCSYFMQKEVNDVLSVPTTKIDVIPNGIFTDHFHTDGDLADFRKKWAFDDEKLVFFVGRDVYEKGAHVLVEAFGDVLRGYNRAKLVIAGKGERANQKEIAEKLGISDRVYFAGFIDDDTLYKLYKVIDVAVFPSIYEPFGIVALEGMAAGVPVVTSDAGGLNEVVDHGVTGIKTRAGDPSSLAWGILQVLQNPTGAKYMADMALNKVKTVYSWSRIAEQTIAVYERVWDEYVKSSW